MSAKTIDQAEVIRDDVRAVRRALRELTAISTLSAVWSRGEPKEIAESLANVLCRALPLDLVYVRLGNNSGMVEACRSSEGPLPLSHAKQIGQQLDSLLTTKDRPLSIANPLDGGALQLAVVPIGVGGEIGVLAAGSRQPQLPGEYDGIILEAAANQSAIALKNWQAQEALRQSEQRYRDLTALMPAAIYTCDASGLITFFNEQAAQLWGRTPVLGDTDERFCGSQQMIRLDGTPLLHEQCPMAVALREGSSFRNQEVNIRRPDASVITVSVNIDPIRDEQGRIVGAINVFHEITALKQAEQALRDSERRFREMIDALPVAIYTTDAVGRLTHFNPAAVEFSGRVPELGSDRWCVSWKLYHPDGTPMPLDTCPMAVALKEGRIVRDAEAIVERPDGTRLWFTPYPTPLRDERGTIVGGINMLLDITERKGVEKERQEHEARLQAIIRGASAGIVLVNLDGRLLEFNPHFSQMLGRPRDDLLTCSCADLTHPEDWACNHPLIAELVQGIRDEFSIEKRYLRGDGRWMWVNVSVSALRDSDGTIDRLLAIVQDIDARKTTEQALERKARQQNLLSEALAALLTAEVPEKVVRDLFPKVADLLGVDTYFNFMVNDSGDALHLHSCGGIAPEIARNLRRLEYGQAICGTVAQKGEAIVATHIQESSYDKAALVRGVGIRCYACNPLKSGGKVIGTLSFASKTQDAFDEEALEFMRLISSYVALAMERQQASQTRTRLAAIVASSDDAIISVGLDGTIQSWNRGAERLFLYTSEETIGQAVTMLIPPQKHDEEPAILDRIRKGQRIDHYETIRRRKDGELIDVDLSVSPVIDATEEIIGASKIARDITQRKRTDALLDAQKRAFEMTASGVPLQRTLEFLATSVEALSQQRARTAIHLLDECGACFEETVAPSLPPEYAQAIHGMKVSSAAGPCCEAILQRVRVDVPSVTDSNFERFAALALPLGIRAGWSAPILSSHGDVLGTIAAYYTEVRPPHEQDVLLGEVTARSAGVIIERHRETQRIEKDLRAMTLLHQVGSVCAHRDADLSACLRHALDAAMTMTGAKKGNIQLFDELRGGLVIAAQHGFSTDFLTFFSLVETGEASACGAAAQAGRQTVVHDVTDSEIFANTPALAVLLNDGVHAVQSTPLISGTGKMIGMISTHHSRPFTPEPRTLRLLELLARTTTDTIERKQAEESLRAHAEELDVFNRAAVGRELRMIELKKEVDALHARLGLPNRYSTDRFDQFEPAADDRVVQELAHD